jgi:hypothetical protein
MKYVGSVKQARMLMGFAFWMIIPTAQVGNPLSVKCELMVGFVWVCFDWAWGRFFDVCPYFVWACVDFSGWV